MLTEDQVSSYHENGYVSIPGIFTEAELDKLEAAVDLTREWLKQVIPTGKRRSIEAHFIEIHKNLEALGTDDPAAHESCDKGLCIFETHQSFGKKHSKALDRLGMVTNEILDVTAPNFTDKNLYASNKDYGIMALGQKHKKPGLGVKVQGAGEMAPISVKRRLKDREEL